MNSLRPLSALAALALPLLGTACTGTRHLQDPLVRVESRTGTELGVATEFGVVFLGRTTQAGEIDLWTWFADGPSIEGTVVEPIGGGLYTCELELELLDVPLSFRAPTPGERVLVMGRGADGELWSHLIRVADEPGVEGFLLESHPRLREDVSQTGAAVFVPSETGVRLVDGPQERMALVGLVSGRVRLETEVGAREYMTVAGPTSLWRLVTYHRADVYRSRFNYRRDLF